MHTLSVTEVTNYLKGLIDNDIILSGVQVQGEVSNFKRYASQWYFTLKDEGAQISCVIFGSVTGKLTHTPQDGESLVVRGKLGVFPKRGSYNLQVFWLAPAGAGELALAFEEMKKRLEQEGLFAPERKKKIPPYPQSIALLAATEGAAVHDFISIAKRRDKGIELTVFPTVVQGKDAEKSIVANLELVNRLQQNDVIVIARGGGSLEDLQAFNTEGVARAIAAAQLPVVAAIGHEVDYTIADFVADLRAPTPSAAAELIVPDKEQLREYLVTTAANLLRGLNRLVVDQYQQVAYFEERLTLLLQQKLTNARHTLQNLSGQLEALSPLKVLARGYAVVEKDSRAVVSRADVKPQDLLTIQLSDGKITAKVEG